MTAGYFLFVLASSFTSPPIRTIAGLWVTERYVSLHFLGATHYAR